MDAAAIIENALAHYGVKGMRWGVRKSEASGNRQQRRIAKKDAQFEKTANRGEAHLMLWSESISTLKKSGDLKRINNKPEYAKSKFGLQTGLTRNKALKKKYNDEVAQKLIDHMKKNASQYVNASGTRRLAIEQAYVGKVYQASKSHWRIVTEEIKQAAENGLSVRIVRDEVDRIIDLIPEPDDLQQSAIAHYGVKGMRWGQRKAARPVSAEAAAKSEVKTQVKKNKISAVSNADLQAAIRRMQLEQDFKRLAVNEKSQISRMVSSMLLEAGKREVQAYAAKKLTVGAVKAVVKKAATGGVA